MPPRKSRTVTFLLCLFFGALGVHRFYVGKVWTGVLYLLTGGLFAIGAIIDLIRIGLGFFTDSDKQSLSAWTPFGCIVAIIGLLIASGSGVLILLATLLKR